MTFMQVVLFMFCVAFIVGGIAALFVYTLAFIFEWCFDRISHCWRVCDEDEISLPTLPLPALMNGLLIREKWPTNNGEWLEIGQLREALDDNLDRREAFTFTAEGGDNRRREGSAVTL